MSDLERLAELVKSCANTGRAALDAARPVSEDLELWAAAFFVPGFPEHMERALRGALVERLRSHEAALRAALDAATALRRALEVMGKKGGAEA